MLQLLVWTSTTVCRQTYLPIYFLLRIRPKLVRFLLSSSVYWSICDVGVPQKWQTGENSVSASNFCFKLGQNVAQTFEMLKVPFVEETGRTQVCEWFSKSKRFWLILTMPNAQYIHQHARHENVDQVRELYCWTEELLTMKWLTCLEFYVCQLGAYRKTFWTCVILPQNLCLICWMRSRGRFMATHGRQFHTFLREKFLSFLRTEDGFKGKETW